MSEHAQKFKADRAKPRWSLIPTGALRDVLAAFEFGARKYATRSWREVPDAQARYLESLRRHVMDLAEAVEEGGADAFLALDEESGLPHLGAIAANALILLDLARHGQ